MCGAAWGKRLCEDSVGCCCGPPVGQDGRGWLGRRALALPVWSESVLGVCVNLVCRRAEKEEEKVFAAVRGRGGRQYWCCIFQGKRERS